MHIIKPPGTDLQNSLSSLTHLGTDNDAFVSFLFQVEDKGDSTANKEQTPSKPLSPMLPSELCFSSCTSFSCQSLKEVLDKVKAHFRLYLQLICPTALIRANHTAGMIFWHVFQTDLWSRRVLNIF